MSVYASCTEALRTSQVLGPLHISPEVLRLVKAPCILVVITSKRRRRVLLEDMLVLLRQNTFARIAMGHAAIRTFSTIPPTAYDYLPPTVMASHVFPAKAVRNNRQSSRNDCICECASELGTLRVGHVSSHASTDCLLIATVPHLRLETSHFPPNLPLLSPFFGLLRATSLSLGP